MKRLNIQIQQRSTVPPELRSLKKPRHSPGTVSRLQHPGLRGGSLCIVWGKIRFVRIDDLHRMKLL